MFFDHVGMGDVVTHDISAVIPLCARKSLVDGAGRSDILAEYQDFKSSPFRIHSLLPPDYLTSFIHFDNRLYPSFCYLLFQPGQVVLGAVRGTAVHDDDLKVGIGLEKAEGGNDNADLSHNLTLAQNRILRFQAGAGMFSSLSFARPSMVPLTAYFGPSSILIQGRNTPAAENIPAPAFNRPAEGLNLRIAVMYGYLSDFIRY